MGRAVASTGPGHIHGRAGRSRNLALVFAFAALVARLSPVSPAPVGRDPEAAQEAQLQKDFSRAAKEYREASKLKPSSELYEKLGLACFLGNSYPEAIEALSESVRLDPRRWSSQLYLGISLYKTNRAALTKKTPGQYAYVRARE